MLKENSPDTAYTYGMYVQSLLICAEKKAHHGEAPFGAALRCTALRCCVGCTQLGVPFFSATELNVVLCTWYT